MRNNDKFLNVMSGIAVACAVVVTSVAVYREFRPHSQQAASSESSRPKDRMIGNWEQQIDMGRGMGPDDAPLTVVYYGDFECPACRRFARVLAEFRGAHPADLRVVFRHLPIPYHRFAYPSARAAECAAAQGRFEPMYDVLYDAQDSLGLVQFRELARRAGVADLHQFDVCVNAPAPVPRVERDLEAAKLAEIPGTPGIIVGGKLILEKQLTFTDLERLANEARRAKR